MNAGPIIRAGRAVQCLSCPNTITEVRLAASPTVARNERLSGYAGSAGVAKVQKLSDISLEELPRFFHRI